jgi:transcriptional regulator with XRE-family HTH domain
MTDDERISGHLAENLRSLRAARGLTQQKLAQASGVPRATLATLESGGGNPTLQVLVRVAQALRVSLEELVTAPRSLSRLYKADTIATEVRSTSHGAVQVRKLLPDPVAGLGLERMALAPGAIMRGTPHTAGTREYLACERGSVELSCSGENHRLEPGDVVVFRGDQKHTYKNPGKVESVAYSVVVLAPSV